MLRTLQSIELDADQKAELDGVLASIKENRPDRGDRPERGETADGADREAHAERKAHREAQTALFASELGQARPDAAALHAMLDEAPRGAPPASLHGNLDAVLGFHATLSRSQRDALVDGLNASEGRKEACGGRERRGERSRRGGPNGG